MKYQQPKKVPVPNVAGYPQTESDMGTVKTVFGTWPDNAKPNVQGTMRGTGAAVKGKRFHEVKARG